MVAIPNGGAVFGMADLGQSVGTPWCDPGCVGAGAMDTDIGCRGHSDDPFDDDDDDDDEFPDDDDVDGDDFDDDDESDDGDDGDDLVGAAFRAGADN